MIDIQLDDFNSMQAQAIRFAREMQRKSIPQPSEPPKENRQETPFCKNACPVKNIFGTGGDSDIMLLMALLLVLTSDGGDKMLMLALLYIMT